MLCACCCKKNGILDMVWSVGLELGGGELEP